MFNFLSNGNDPLLVTRADSLSEATYRVLAKLAKLPFSTPSRAGETKELSPHLIALGSGAYGEPDPTTILPCRGNNVFATIAETLWVYAGRNDIGTLSRWLPRAPEYSDDGKTWSSGYGPRARAWGGPRHPVDQIESMLRRLRRRADTRQALLVLWDPAADGVKENSKDYCCNILVHALVRDEGLSLYVTTRSNDIIYGVAINVFQWCFLGSYLSECLGVPFANYYHYSSSLHLYDWKSETAAKVLAHKFRAPPRLALVNRGVRKWVKLESGDFKIRCEEIFTGAHAKTLSKFRSGYAEELPARLADCYYALRAETELLAPRAKAYLALLGQIRFVPLVLSLLDIGQRRRKEPLWDKEGFCDLWRDTAEEIKAARYLKHLYSANGCSNAGEVIPGRDEGHHVLQRG